MVARTQKQITSVAEVSVVAAAAPTRGVESMLECVVQEPDVTRSPVSLPRRTEDRVETSAPRGSTTDRYQTRGTVLTSDSGFMEDSGNVKRIVKLK